jgi:hypothetical protein
MKGKERMKAEATKENLDTESVNRKGRAFGFIVANIVLAVFLTTALAKGCGGLS